eukprot:6218803-Amphidinium_carterae.1
MACATLRRRKRLTRGVAGEVHGATTCSKLRLSARRTEQRPEAKRTKPHSNRVSCMLPKTRLKNKGC